MQRARLPSPFLMAGLMALKSTHYYRIGSCLTRQRKVVSLGHNKPFKTHPLARSVPSLGLHAEMDAVTTIRGSLRGYSLYLTRIIKSQSIRMARPCEVCQGFLLERGLRRVYYTIDDYNYGILDLYTGAEKQVTVRDYHGLFERYSRV